MEIRRERYLIIYGWQQLEGKKIKCSQTKDR